jgi:hypothetical protein
MQDFLDLKQSGGFSGGAAAAVNAKGNKTTPPQGRKVERKVDLRVLLPDHSLVTVPISEHWRAMEVFQVCCINICILSNMKLHDMYMYMYSRVYIPNISCPKYFIRSGFSPEILRGGKSCRYKPTTA